MSSYRSAQGNIAHLRRLSNGKYSVRIADKHKMTFLAEVTDTTEDAEVLICMHGDYWTEMVI